MIEREIRSDHPEGLMSGTVMTDYLMPLRKNVKAKLSVPSDLTPDEAKKIMKFIREFLL